MVENPDWVSVARASVTMAMVGQGGKPGEVAKRRGLRSRSRLQRRAWFNRSMRVARFVPVAVVIAVALAACGGPSGSRLAALQSMPENTLAYPGASILRTVSVEATQTIEGPVPAISGHTFGAEASEADVVAFYQRQLAERGWLPTSFDAQRSTIETAAYTWQKDAAVLRLAILERGADPRLPSASEQAEFRTIYRIDLMDHPAASPGS